MAQPIFDDLRRMFASLHCKPFFLLIALFPLCAGAQDGGLDFSFNAGSGPTWAVHSVVLQADGKVVVGGDFDTFNNVARKHVARLNSSGGVDLTFNSSPGPNSIVRAVAVQPDGKILIAGNFSTYNGTARGGIARLTATGGLDGTFSGPGIVTSGGYHINSIAVQPDGKILVAGDFTVINGVEREGVARLNADGSLDMTFDQGIGTSTLAYGVKVQTDGKIIVYGDFQRYDGILSPKIVRLNADGSFDPSFDVGGGASNVIVSAQVQPDGKIVVAGLFDIIDGITVHKVGRLNADGSVDAGFDVGAGTQVVQNVYGLELQPDGKIIVVGEFMEFNELPYNRICRLDATGALDPTFDPGTGFTDPGARALDAVLQPDGKILVAGAFAHYNGSSRVGILRLHNQIITGEADLVMPKGARVYPNPAHDELYFQSPTDAGAQRMHVRDLQGRTVIAEQWLTMGQVEAIDVSALVPGVYMAHVTMGAATVVLPFVHE